MICRNCKICGRFFWVYPYRLKKGGGKYCGTECYEIAKGGTVNCRCDNCDKDIRKSKYSYEKHDHHFCDYGCYTEYRRLYPRTLKLRNIVKARRFYKENKDHALKQQKELRQRQRDNMDDVYIKELIKVNVGTNIGIPKELIELKRLNLKRKRVIRNHNQKA